MKRHMGVRGTTALATAAALVWTATAYGQAVELFYVSVPPCRIVNTTVAGGAIGAGTVRNFKVKGTSSLTSQGGSATGCGVSTSATAAIINFVAVNPTGAGDLRAWAYSNPPLLAPLASILNYAAVAGLNIANGIAIPLCSGTCSFDLRVQADASATDLVADVVGYFTPFTGKTFAVCGQPGSCFIGQGCGSSTVVGGACAPCTITSETGSCSVGAGAPGFCSACKP